MYHVLHILRMKIKLLILLFTFLAVGCSKQSATTIIQPTTVADARYNQTLSIRDKTLHVQIVTTDADMEQGLSGRPNMANDEGMLFNFGAGTNGRPGFWMKDMNFNLDFIWIKNNSIVGITPNAPAPVNCKSSIVNCDATLPIYYPPSPVDMVLEVNAGWAEKNEITVGDTVTLK